MIAIFVLQMTPFCRVFVFVTLLVVVNSQNTSLNVVELAQSLGLNTFVQYLNENEVTTEWTDPSKIESFCYSLIKNQEIHFSI